MKKKRSMRIRVLWVVREELSVEDSFQQTELREGAIEFWEDVGRGF